VSSVDIYPPTTMNIPNIWMVFIDKRVKMRATAVLIAQKAQAKVNLFHLNATNSSDWYGTKYLNFIEEFKTYQGVQSHHQYKHVEPGHHDCPIDGCKRCEWNYIYDESFVSGSH